MQERLLGAKLKEDPKFDGLTPWYEHDEMPVQRVENENFETEFAQEFENELPERVENELVQQVVDSVLEDGANSSLPRRDGGEFGGLLQNNLDRSPLSSAFATFTSAPATLRMTTVPTCCHYIGLFATRSTRCF